MLSEKKIRERIKSLRKGVDVKDPIIGYYRLVAAEALEWACGKEMNFSHMLEEAGDDLEREIADNLSIYIRRGSAR